MAVRQQNGDWHTIGESLPGSQVADLKPVFESMDGLNRGGCGPEFDRIIIRRGFGFL